MNEKSKEKIAQSASEGLLNLFGLFGIITLTIYYFLSFEVRRAKLIWH